MNADEREHQPRRIVGGQFGVEDDLLARPACHRPTRVASAAREARRVQLGKPRLLKPGEFLVADPGLSRPPIARDVLLTPGTDVGAEPVEIGRHAYNPVRPPLPARRVSSSRVADNPSGSRRSGWL